MNTIKNHYDVLIKHTGKICSIGTTQFSGVFREIRDSLDSIDDKHFITNYNLSQGDVFTFNNINYFVLNKEDLSHGIYYRYTVRKCINYIKFNFEGDIKQEDCLFESKNISLESNNYFNTVANEMLIILKSNAVTNKAKVNTKVIKFNNKWNVEGVDKTKENIIILHCKVVASNENDDFESEIADRWLYEKLYTYTMDAIPTSIELNEGDTQQIVTTIKENNVLVSNPTLIYTSDNPLIATVSDGIVTGVLEGVCNITISFTGKDNNVYTKTIPIVVTKAIVVDPATYEITCDVSIPIRKLVTGTFEGVKKLNGVVVPSSWVFTIDYMTMPTSSIALSSITSTSIDIKAMTDTGTFKLIGTESSGAVVIVDVSLRSQWG